MSLSIDEKRRRLAEFEIHEVWPTKEYKDDCERRGEPGRQSEEEIRTYFAELSEAEVGYVWDDTFGWEEQA